MRHQSSHGETQLRPCESCGKEISENARWCPTCGEPDPHYGYRARLESEAESRRQRVLDENQRRVVQMARGTYPGAFIVSLISLTVIAATSALSGASTSTAVLVVGAALLGLPLGFAISFVLGTNESPLEDKSPRRVFSFFAPNYAAALAVQAVLFVWRRLT